MRRGAVLGLLFVSSCLVSACGGAKPAADSPAEPHDTKEEAPSAAEEPAAAAPEQESSVGIPTTCHDGKGAVCTPDPKFVRKLCNGVYPSVALYMFRGSTPWTRGYLTRKTRAVNASGGPTSGNEWLAFDEEVLLLYSRASDFGGMQVSGAGGGYDALRWDGSCVTLGSDEVTTQKAPKPKYNQIDWRYLEEGIQEGLRKDERVTTAYRARRQECKGVNSGTVSDKCVKADAALTEAIVSAVKGGVELPEPKKLPE